MNPEIKTCQNCKMKFGHHALELEMYHRMQVPPPEQCLRCRRQHRLAFWPFGNFYVRKCDLSGESIITTYPPETKFPIYKREHWYSDKWKAPEMEIDLERPFFDQLYELQSKTPHFHMLGDAKSSNCDYCDDVWESKSCYLCRSFCLCEDMYYTYRNIRVKSSMDVTFCFDLDQCYECTYCFNSYNLHWSVDSRNCMDSYFLYDCRNCSNCFMSWNLRNKNYCILNKQYSPEEYKKELAKLALGSFAALQKFRAEFAEHLRMDVIHKPDFNTQTETSLGNFLDKCKNCIESILTGESENSYDIFRGHQDKDCVSISGLLTGELCSNIMQATNLYNVQYAMYCVDCSNSQYLDQCQSAEDCFGCVGLFKRQYCILNKQYSKEEYEQLKRKIIEKMRERGEYGKFFPWAMVYNGYNASLAHMYYPNETAESVKQKGGKWEEPPASPVQGVSSDQLPDHINEAEETWIGRAIECPRTGRSFKVVKQEFHFYKSHQLPLPRYYPDERNRERYRYMLAVESRQARCFRCQEEITTYYPEDWGYQKIACGQCYKNLVL